MKSHRTWAPGAWAAFVKRGTQRDDEDGFGALVHLQFQPELLVNCVEEGELAVGVRWSARPGRW
jgi:hypothetical protein